MQVIISLLVAVAVAFAGRNVLKAYPTVLYVIAVIVDIVAVVGHGVFGFEGAAWRAFYGEIRRGLLSFGFLMVVMFIGCLPKGSKVRRWLQPVRAELSIIAALLMIPHVVLYLDIYNRYMGTPNLMESSVALYASYALSILITVLLAVLTVTSFRVVRKRMDSRVWKRVQILAYPFFVLVWLHVFLVRLRPAPGNWAQVLDSTKIYAAVVAVYVVARIVRAILDRRAEGRGAPAEAESVQVEAKSVQAAASDNDAPVSITSGV